jgi:ParE toxin of type II toxin-antitoxin system, parDE
VIRYTASVLRDIDRAYNWYEDRKEGLGDRFIAEVRDTAAAIDLNPPRVRKAHRGGAKGQSEAFSLFALFQGRRRKQSRDRLPARQTG